MLVNLLRLFSVDNFETIDEWLTAYLDHNCASFPPVPCATAAENSCRRPHASPTPAFWSQSATVRPFPSPGITNNINQCSRKVHRLIKQLKVASAFLFTTAAIDRRIKDSRRDRNDSRSEKFKKRFYSRQTREGMQINRRNRQKNAFRRKKIDRRMISRIENAVKRRINARLIDVWHWENETWADEVLREKVWDVKLPCQFSGLQWAFLIDFVQTRLGKVRKFWKLRLSRSNFSRSSDQSLTTFKIKLNIDCKTS